MSAGDVGLQPADRTAMLQMIGSGAVSNPVADVSEADVLLIIGSNTTENHPVAATLKTGTFTNTDRRVQLGRQALSPPGEARQDPDLIIDLAQLLRLDWHNHGPECRTQCP